MAAVSIVFSLIGLGYRPFRLTIPAIAVALIAAAIGGRYQRLATVAVGVGGVCWFGGMTIAVLTGHSLW